MKKYYVTVEFFGVEAESREDAIRKVAADIVKLGIGDEPEEYDAEEEW